VWTFNVATGTKELLAPKVDGQLVTYGAAQFSKDGRGIYVTTDRDSEFQRLAYLDLTTHQYTVLTDYIKWDIQDFKLSPDGEMIALQSNEEWPHGPSLDQCTYWQGHSSNQSSPGLHEWFSLAQERVISWVHS